MKSKIANIIVETGPAIKFPLGIILINIIGNRHNIKTIILIIFNFLLLVVVAIVQLYLLIYLLDFLVLRHQNDVHYLLHQQPEQ